MGGITQVLFKSLVTLLVTLFEQLKWQSSHSIHIAANSTASDDEKVER